MRRGALQQKIYVPHIPLDHAPRVSHVRSLSCHTPFWSFFILLSTFWVSSGYAFTLCARICGIILRIFLAGTRTANEHCVRSASGFWETREASTGAKSA